MEVTKVKEAARLLDQYEKLTAFIREAPEDANMVTITLRCGSASKSVSLRNEPPHFDVMGFARERQETAIKRLRELGVEV